MEVDFKTQHAKYKFEAKLKLLTLIKHTNWLGIEPPPSKRNLIE